MDEEEEISTVYVPRGIEHIPPGIVFVPNTMVTSSPILVGYSLRRYGNLEINPNFFGRITLSKQFKFGRGFIWNYIT